MYCTQFGVGVDVTMDGELISTMNQKYIYKSYIETVLNNSHSTKKYQLKSSGYYGDEGNKDEDYISTWNKGMEQRCMIFRNGNKDQINGIHFVWYYGYRSIHSEWCGNKHDINS